MEKDRTTGPIAAVVWAVYRRRPRHRAMALGRKVAMQTAARPLTPDDARALPKAHNGRTEALALDLDGRLPLASLYVQDRRVRPRQVLSA
jgi:hypothetical protein